MYVIFHTILGDAKDQLLSSSKLPVIINGEKVLNMRLFWKPRFIFSFFLALSVITYIYSLASAVLPILRPITNGVFNQTYLYGEFRVGATIPHRGIDIPTSNGTDVYPVRDGFVVALREGVADNGNTAGLFGNYVMIRHGQTYDRINSQTAYVYSIYAHLKFNSVTPIVGQFVTTGTQIAKVNNTGNTTGDHLHVQISLSNDVNKTDPEDWSWSEFTARNPEAWIKAFNNGSTPTASVMGKVADNSGTPLDKKQIWGLAKPAVVGGSTFDYVQTYDSSTSVHPDDIFVENFATTDITPGTHCLEARNSNGSFYENMGCYDFVAGRTTYVGLYPVYLPDIRGNGSNGWYSTISIRNNSTTVTAKVFTTYYQGSSVHSQRPDSIGPNTTLRFSAASMIGSAIVVASEDISVVVSHERTGGIYTHEAYAGVDNPTSEVRVPIAQRNNSGFNSDLFIQNTGNINTNVTALFIPAPGYGTNQSFTLTNLEPNAIWTFQTSSFPALGTFVGSVRITNSANQLLAVASTQYKDSGGVSQLFETSNTQPPATTLYAPLIQNNNSGNLAGLTLSSTGGSNFGLYYYYTLGTLCSNPTGLTNNPLIVYPAPAAGNPCPTTPPGKFLNSVAMVANVNQLKTNSNAATYAAISTPKNTAIIAKVRRVTGWDDGFVVANFSGNTATVTVNLYYTNGTFHSTIVNQLLSNNTNLVVFGQIPVGFDGSAVVSATQPVAVIANSLRTGFAGDVLGSYPATHR